MGKKGFTLIELLVVVAIIAVLVSILLPGLSASREISKSLVCVSLLKQYGVANQSYLNEFNGYTVPALQGDYQNAHWMWNQKFRSYLRVPPHDGDPAGNWRWARWPKELACPNATYAFSKSAMTGYAYMPYSYGFNCSGLGDLRYVSPWGYRFDQVINPSGKLLVADGLTWWLHIDHSSYYADYFNFTDDVDNNSFVNTCAITAYRHRKSANILFMDGHSSSLDFLQIVNNIALWNPYR